MSELDPGYPLSAFNRALSSVAGRTVIFVVVCVFAILIGSWIRVGWRDPTVIIWWTVLASFASSWGFFCYSALVLVLILFLRFERSWICVPVAFIVQAVDAYFVAS